MCKLSDFGSSKRLFRFEKEDKYKSKGLNISLQGSLFWMAPEVIKQQGHGFEAEIWSIGCTTIEMLTGKPPYYQSHTNSVNIYIYYCTIILIYLFINRLVSSTKLPIKPNILLFLPIYQTLLYTFSNHVSKYNPQKGTMLKTSLIIHLLLAI